MHIAPIRERLKNGVRFLQVKTPWTKAATILVLTKVGSRYEDARTNGISHFVEHLMFKGTEKRPNTLAISGALDRVGAEYNAFTGKDYTGYYIKIPREHFPVAADTVFDMLTHSKFAEEELQRERKVILEEIKMYEENPLMHIEDLFESALFKGSTLGWNIAGSKASMMRITREDVVNFVKRNYSPKNIVVAVVGDLEKPVLDAVRDSCAEFSAHKGPAKKFAPATVAKGVSMRVHTQAVEQVQFSVGFPAYGYGDKHLPALKLLHVALGGNMSSRLFISVRERRGLAYTVRTDVSPYNDIGSFRVQAGLDAARLKEAITVIMQELARAKKGITKKELQDSKEFIRGKISLGFEDTLEIADWYGKQELIEGTILTPEEKIDSFMKVTLDDVKKVADTVIQDRTIAAGLIGPFENEKEFLPLLKL